MIAQHAAAGGVLGQRARQRPQSLGDGVTHATYKRHREPDRAVDNLQLRRTRSLAIWFIASSLRKAALRPFAIRNYSGPGSL